MSAPVAVAKTQKKHKKDVSSLERMTPLSRGVVLFAMTVVAIYCFLPVWWLIVSATKPSSQTTTTNGFWFSDFDLVQNIKNVFSADNAIFGQWLLNSLGYAVLGAIVGTLIAVMFGYALAKYKFPGNGVTFGAVLAAVFIPAPILAVPMFLMFSKIGINDTFWSVFIPVIVSPFGVYLSRIFAADSVPDEIMESARLDGAGEVRIFFQIGLRLMAPALLTIFLFQFVSIWTNVLLPKLMLNGSDKWPVTLGLVDWQQKAALGQGGINTSIVLTGAFLSVIPVIIMFLSLQNFWSKGLAKGAIK
jgi:multiple sugar transport system permease protein